MSKIRLHGSSSGYTEIAPVAASGNNTLTLPNDGTIISKDSNGAVGVTSITVGTGVTIGDGRITCSTLHGSAASLTAIPAANIVGVCTSGLTKTGGFSDYVKLQAATGTSAVSDLTFNSLDVTTYRTFKMVFSGYPSTDGAEFYFRFRDGSSDKSNASTYNWVNYGVNGAGSIYDNAGSDSKALICYNAGNNNYEGWRFELTFVPHVSGDPDYQNNFGHTVCNRFTESNSHRGEMFHFKFHQSDTVDGFRLFPSSGNIAAYSYTLYGLKR